MILVLVPVFFEICFAVFLIDTLEGAANKLSVMQRASDNLRLLQEAEGAIIATAMNLREPNQHSAERLRDLDHSLALFNAAAQIPKTDSADFPELNESVEQQRDFRKRFTSYVAKLRRYLSSDNTPMVYSGPGMPTVQDSMSMLYEGYNFANSVVRAENHIQTYEPEQLNRFRSVLINGLVGWFLVNCLIAALLAILFSRDIKVRLSTVAENARRIGAGQPLVAVSGSDEIAQLAKAFEQSNSTLKETRNRQLAVLDNAADVLCALDGRLKFVAAGAAAEKSWGYVPDVLLGRSLLTILEGVLQEYVVASFSKIAEGAGSGEMEYSMRCADGTICRTQWKVQWSSDKKQFFCVVHDITELRALEALKQQFISIVSHDLRTPLTSIQISVDTLLSGKRGEIGSGPRRLMETCKRGLGRLIELVNELLELQKLESGTMNLQVDSVSAADVCRMATESLQSLAQEAGVELIGPIGDAPLIADEKRLGQAVINLVANAIKFSPPQAKITVNVTASGGTVEIAVSDNGPGVPHDERDLIFEKFHQTANRATIAIKGTGLGLAIVKAIVEAHGGTVGVRDSVPQGSTFWMRMPGLDGGGEDDP